MFVFVSFYESIKGALFSQIYDLPSGGEAFCKATVLYKSTVLVLSSIFGGELTEMCFNI
jgi:hypothetical protein